MLSDGAPSQGDTQPISQSVYERYNSRFQEQQQTRHGGEPGETIEDQDYVPHTLQPGESGHIDLLAAYEQPSIIDDEIEDDMDPLSQEIRADIFPESRRFQAPKTPASQNRKRKRGADTSSQGQATPQLPINPFAGQLGSIDGIMGASQLFQATQAVTSPLSNMLPSDGLSERPSPGMHNIQRPLSADSLSSPAVMPRTNMIRAVTEPQTTYISMKESQEARERMLEARKAQLALSPDELSDEEFAENSQLQRHLRKKRYILEAKNQFAAATAQSEAATCRQERGRRGHRIAGFNRDSPRVHRTQAAEPVLISDDVAADVQQGSITEDETEREDDPIIEGDNDSDELADENKENVEVPRTVTRVNRSTSQVVSSQPTPSRHLIQGTKFIAEVTKERKNDAKIEHTRFQKAPGADECGTQPDAIADSQSSQRLKHNSIAFGQRAFSEPRSSLDSRVLIPQSQSSEGSRIPRTLESHKPDLMRNDTMETSSGNTLEHASPSKKTVISRNSAIGAGSSTTNGACTVKSSERSPNSEASEDPRSTISKAVEPLPSKSSPGQSTIPETDSNTEQPHLAQEMIANSSNAMPSPKHTPKSACNAASSNAIPEQSRASTLFETALENQTNSPSKTHPQRMLQKSQNKQPSPGKRKRPRSMSEIAADPSPPDDIGEVDVDIDLLSNEDIEFQQALHGSSPITYSAKRRRGGRSQQSRTARNFATSLPQLPRSPLPPPSSAISAITPVQSSSPTNAYSLSAKTGLQSISAAISPPSKLRDRLAQARASSAEPKVISKPAARPAALHLQGKDQPNGAQGPEASSPQRSGEPAPQQADELQKDQATMVAPNRVFAHFNGTSSAYHPATCLEMYGGEEPRYSVRFDDGTMDTISAYGIKRLELRVGDVIKVDVPGARMKNYIVLGMQDLHRSATPPDPETPSRRGRKHSTNDAAFPETDIYGFATVLASPKQREGKGDEIAIPLTQIYLTQTLWTAYKNRQYTHVPGKSPFVTGLQTPSDRPSTPSTPSSRTRRTKSSGLNRSRTMASVSREGIFENMVFAVTNIDRTEDNKRVKDTILSSGGVVLENGFEELFNIPTLNRTTSPVENTNESFQITAAAQDVGFTCLIADRHCRRAKFIQALALGIPCLATRWVYDCINKQQVLPWGPYLLPSGESSFLGGAVRSRNLHPFLADTAALSHMVNNRPRLLNGASVLLIMEKGQEGLMKQHTLIAHALGAKKVCRAVSEEEAMKVVADAQTVDEPWDWVFSYDKEKEIEKRLIGGSSSGRKRKRGRESEASDVVRKSRTRVMGNEFVIQSLILGMLVDE